KRSGARSITCKPDGGIEITDDPATAAPHSDDDDWEMPSTNSGASLDGRLSPPGEAAAAVAPPRDADAMSDRTDSSWTKVLEDLETCGNSRILRELEESIMKGSERRLAGAESPLERPGFRKINDAIHTMLSPAPVELHKVALYKDAAYDDFGFSVSDGLHARGVYVARTRAGGPAAASGIQPYDRLLQINATRTRDVDCCLAVPLIAASGDRIELVISRNPLMSRRDLADPGGGAGPWD
ncbi:PREDICTED: LOW QUALITY PROTEIN: glutamate receptor-interacting protein 1-like, partial [Priapulus caudatus]|uniref:LOW QUALITY PROTEIN: glutamate receptor-interacting protein 1-like n=1 Tax=Priapulus caudatus TaxID=37621 RepID=A0ABM1F6U5_PRICU